jgi:hypothetical protein
MICRKHSRISSLMSDSFFWRNVPKMQSSSYIYIKYFSTFLYNIFDFDAEYFSFSNTGLFNRRIPRSIVGLGEPGFITRNYISQNRWGLTSTLLKLWAIPLKASLFKFNRGETDMILCSLISNAILFINVKRLYKVISRIFSCLTIITLPRKLYRLLLSRPFLVAYREITMKPIRPMKQLSPKPRFGPWYSYRCFLEDATYA